MTQKLTKKAVSQYTFVLENKLGEGAYSQVFMGKNQKTGQKVAVKVISLSKAIKSHTIKNIELQINALYKLKNQIHIVAIKQAVQTKNNIYIMTQFCDSGNLRQWIKKQRKFSQKTSIELIKKIIDGYILIAKAGLIHRDIKPENIFIHGSEIKIGDFGFAINANQCQKPLIQNIGSPLYMAPEALTSCRYSFQSDIWAIGLIFLEMLKGNSPFKSNTEKQLKSELLQFKIEGYLPKKLSQKSRQFLIKTLQVDVSKRMNLEQLALFKFINNCVQEEKNESFLHKQRSNNGDKSTIAQNNIYQSKQQLLIPKRQYMPQLIENNKSTPNLKTQNKKKMVKKNTFSYNNQHLQKQQISKQINLPHQIQIKRTISQNDKKDSQILHLSSQTAIKNQKINPFFGNHSQKTIQNQPINKFLKRSASFVLQTNAQKSNKVVVPFVSSINLYELPQLYENEDDSQDQQALKIIQHNKQNKDNNLQKKVDQPYNKNMHIVQSTYIEKKTDQIYQKIQQMQEKCQFIEQLKKLTSQICYFKLLNQILKYVDSCLKIQNQKIQIFKSNLAFLIIQKLEQLKNLKLLKMSNNQRQIFITTRQFYYYTNIIRKIQQKYVKRYTLIKPELKSPKEFISTLSYVLILLYKKIQKYKNDLQKINSKKIIVIIIDSLISLSTLYFLDKQYNWSKFQLKSNIQQLLSRGRVNTITQQYYESVCKRYEQINYN